MFNPLLKTLTNAVDRIDALTDLVIRKTDSNGYVSYIIQGSTLNEIHKNLDFILELVKSIDKCEQINEQIKRDYQANSIK